MRMTVLNLPKYRSVVHVPMIKLSMTTREGSVVSYTTTGESAELGGETLPIDKNQMNIICSSSMRYT